jgi:hypothetical protein
MSAEDLRYRDMNFKVSPSFHRGFQLTAVARGMSMVELLKLCYGEWILKHGSPDDLRLGRRAHRNRRVVRGPDRRAERRGGS